MSVDTMLERLVPEPETFGDWEDVLQRAGITKRALPPRKVLVAAGAAVLLVVLFATPAFGVLLDLIGRTNVPFTGKAAPTRVQRTFFDMSVASPPGMGPHAIASQTRRVGVLVGRALYVSPTRDGGFCWLVEHGGGSCSSQRGRNSGILSLTWEMIRHRGGPLRVRVISGAVLAAKTQTLTVEYRDGTKQPIPFIWVTKPINAGFFLFPIPKNGAGGVVAVSARDGKGHVLARESFVRPRIPHPRHPVVPRSYRPPPPPPAPTAPFQRGSANGVTVVVGANGIAEFQTADPLLQKGSWACLKFIRYHQVDPFELGFEAQARHGDRISLNGLKAPVDGCEVQEGYGHVWPDPHGYHGAAEIAFTARAKRYFADRAAARELALYLRWSKHHPNAPATGITVSHHGGVVVYSIRSTTGKRFSVTKHGGRIVRENVRPYAGPL
jgi:hypothetical protein